MADKSKMTKRKLEEESKSISRAVDREVSFVENKGGIICLICKQNVNMLKEYNLG
jgi:hypothetical protein